jgi:hypothetical protein
MTAAIDVLDLKNPKRVYSIDDLISRCFIHSSACMKVVENPWLQGSPPKNREGARRISRELNGAFTPRLRRSPYLP